MRTWERGAGATLACGTGASAVCVAGVLTGRGGATITAHLPGGDLELSWPGAGKQVRMSGPAVEVFEGELCGSSGAGSSVGSAPGAGAAGASGAGAAPSAPIAGRTS